MYKGQKWTRPGNLRRAGRYAILSAAAAAITLGVAALRPDRAAVARLSLGTAYAGVAFLALVLAIGPWNLLRQRPNPTSIGLRRDVGICAGILALVHTVLGLQVHFGGDFVLYFIFPDPAEHLLPLRYDAFGIANYTGLFATLLILVLLALSNNASLRRLGVRRWKSLQRWVYLGAGFVVIHGALYQILERRDAALVVAFGLISGFAIIFQGLGIRQRRWSELPAQSDAMREVVDSTLR